MVIIVVWELWKHCNGGVYYAASLDVNRVGAYLWFHPGPKEHQHVISKTDKRPFLFVFFLNHWGIHSTLFCVGYLIFYILLLIYNKMIHTSPACYKDATLNLNHNVDLFINSPDKDHDSNFCLIVLEVQPINHVNNTRTSTLDLFYCKIRRNTCYKIIKLSMKILGPLTQSTHLQISSN